MALDDFEWIVVCAALASFAMAWGIGANDVANAFASSVGSKALTLRQACVIAAVFEFAGAVGLGAAVTRTVAGSIADSKLFQPDPDIFMYGMLCALVAAAAWLYIATYFSIPVSTTHSIIGGVLGMALVYAGADGVRWMDPIDEFPFYRGVGIVMISWVTSPVLCGALGIMFFLALRTFVLRSKNPVRMGLLTLPIVVFFVIWAYVWFILAKGITAVKKFDKTTPIWISAVTAAGAALLAAATMPFIKKRLLVQEGEREIAEEAAAKDVEVNVSATKPVPKKAGVLGLLTRGVDVDVHEVVITEDSTHAMHEHAEKFDPNTENLYKYAQIFSACCDAFAHGANDVANSVGPFAAIYFVYRNDGKISSNSDCPKWILAMGGFGIVVGLATYGYNIIRVLGVQTCKITPSRGFCIEMSTAMVVAFGSALGIPLSTTQCQVGATWGVGLAEGRRGINWLVSVKIFLGWVFTLFLTCGISAALFAQGIYSPSRVASNKVHGYENWIVNMTRTQMRDFNRSLYALPPFKDFDTYAVSLAVMDNGTRNLTPTRKLGTQEPNTVLPYANNILSMMKNFTAYTIAVDRDNLDVICLKEAGVPCAHPKLLDATVEMAQPMTKKL